MKGTYFLIITVSKNSGIKIGSLGKILFQKGQYAYIGSALNSLEARLNRHFRRDKKIHWHIDYLLSAKNAVLEKAFLIESKKRLECGIAKEFAKKGIAITGFGCSDCKCKSHLFKINPKKVNIIKTGRFKEWKT